MLVVYTFSTMIQTMDVDKLMQVLSPFYGVWRTSGALLTLKSRANALYGSAAEDAADRRQDILRQGGTTAAGFVLFMFLLVFAILVPAVQAFGCFGATNLYLPGWAWGILILLFWPLGLVWLVFKGGCASDGSGMEVFANFGPSSEQAIGTLPAMPGLFGQTGGASTAALLLTPGDTMDGSSLFS